MKTRPKNPATKMLIDMLVAASVEKKAPVWKAVADNINRPRRIKREVNLSSFEKTGNAKEIIVIPGVVLGGGEAGKHLKVAALKFSSSAREKIEKAGGKCMSIEELVAEHPAGKNVRILG
jgi:large subunit ribosomal protein L18e